MRRQGTTKDEIISRRSRGQASRLGIKFRRILVGAAFLSVFFWAGSWLWLGGHAHKFWNQTLDRSYEFAATHGFSVQNILVEGRINTDPDILRALVNIERGDAIFAVDPNQLRDSISRISWVRDVHIERRLPDTLFIGLEERAPLALWQNRGKLRLIDAEGVTLSDKNLDGFSRYFLVVGEDAPKEASGLMRLLAAEPVLNDRVEAAVRVGSRRWDLRMKNGLVIKLPETDIGGALRRLCAAQETDKILDKGLVAIDLREEGRMTVRTQPGAADEYKADTVSATKKDI